MPSERVQRQIDRLLDQAEQALEQGDLDLAREKARLVLGMDAENADAMSYLAAVESAQESSVSSPTRPTALPQSPNPSPQPPAPTSFCDGRYEVVRFLGEGGKKRVYLAHDAKLDRDVAFALIKTDGLDDDGLLRIKREAQAMGRLGDHPHIVSVHDIGDESGQPYLVSQLMPGGDVEGLVEKATDHRLPLNTALRIADQVCQALEHAHKNGIVHRDLKPGNVWLTEDGIAKLGDFGLALALDRARLTQAGMMVGTVSYMPPEQALGGEVTPRSDLYSLGAMLYEMTTGRPPFVGDESVAIITQHLNTPPVAPSWHTPDLPPGLEALILRLLEKDPAKRPGSAAEVRSMLAGLQPRPHPHPLPEGEGKDASPPGRGRPEAPDAGVSAIPQPPTLSTQNPLYRRTFVGREAELRQLHAAYDAALSGQGGLAMVVGEPGIGKTSLCEQLTTYASLRGGRALIGHCYEEGSLSLPYLPFVEAMRTYVLARDSDGLRTDLGSGAAEVARIVSEVRDRLPVETRPPGDPEEERWRLLQAVAGFLRNASSVQPLLLVLEDLHDADRGTLDLLVHLARNLEGARLLIVGTYRDVEVDRSHPLSGALADLRRHSSFLRVPLRGLTAEEVQRMMASVAQRDVPWPLAELLHRQTEGNPLFVQEMLRYLVEEGLIAEQQGTLRRAGEESLAGRIPEGLRDVIGKRLSRLSDQTNQILSVAAVIGREFRLDVLQQVAGLGDQEMESALEQAQERAIVEQRSTVGALVFRFTHAFFRQTLYEEIFASRRLRLHQQVARALEGVYGRRVEDHAAELAEHFAQSTDATDLVRALEYSRLAAQRSMQVFAYGEAARHLDQALKLQEVLDPDSPEALRKRCDLLLALGEALLPTDEPSRVADVVAPEAFNLAERLGDSEAAARAAIQALEAMMRGQEVSNLSPEYREWAVRADRHAPAGSIDRVYADVFMGRAAMNRDRAEAHRFLRQAVDLADGLDDHRAYFGAAGTALRFLQALRDYERLAPLADGVLGRPRDGVRPVDLAQCLRAAGTVLLAGGDRAGAERAWKELSELAARTRDAAIALWAREPTPTLAFLDGQIEDVVAECEALSADMLATTGGVEAYYLLPRALLYLGRTNGLRPLLDSFPPLRPMRAALACWRAHLGRTDEARRIRAEFEGIGSDEDESALVILVHLLEAAIVTRDEATIQKLVRRLAPLAGASCVVHVPTSHGRLLGEAAVLLGEPEQARQYFEQGIDACGKIGFRPEIALIHLDLAELLLDEAVSGQLLAVSDAGDAKKQTADELKAEGMRHLDFAIDEFRAMKMQPYLERALRHKGLLHA